MTAKYCQALPWQSANLLPPLPTPLGVAVGSGSWQAEGPFERERGAAVGAEPLSFSASLPGENDAHDPPTASAAPRPADIALTEAPNPGPDLHVRTRRLSAKQETAPR